MNRNYEDKEFKEIYQDLVDNVKKLTNKWDPSLSDESDPGVVILKSFALYLDKLNYKINYRNSQNSIEAVSDPIEAKRLFSELGYPMVEKRSATTNLSVKYIKESGTADIPLFSQFSDLYGNQNYTNSRSAYLKFSSGETKLIEVQEGIPAPYSYEGKEVFTENDLTTNLRLYLKGLNSLSSNGIVICTNKENITVSNWLNIGRNQLSSVETNNVFSINYDPKEGYYIQFYEKSLPGLLEGIKIWSISSSGSAGNVPKNTICKVVSLESGNPEDFLITHNVISNGSDSESIEEARKNYYDSFGINNTIVSDRDYENSLQGVIRPDLSKLCSKAMARGVGGLHNTAEIVSPVTGGTGRAKLIKILTGFVNYIYVNLLKDSSNYYESFKKLTDEDSDNTKNLLIKSLQNNSVVSNEVVLTNYSDSVGSIYDEFIFDLASLTGTVIVNSEEEIETIRRRIILAIYRSFNSSYLKTGELLRESELARVVKEEVEGIVSATFYYSNHKIVKNVSTGSSSLTPDGVEKGLTKEVIPTGEGLNEGEKVDLIARNILTGNLSLFEENSLQVPPGTLYESGSNKIVNFTRPTGSGSTTEEVSLDNNSSKITKIIGKIIPTTEDNITYSTELGENEFIQFYTKSLSEKKRFGLGVPYIFRASQIKTQKTIALSQTEYSYLLSGSILAIGSSIYIQSQDTLEAFISQEAIPSTSKLSTTTNDLTVTLDKEYKVTGELKLYKSSLATNSIIRDGSIIYLADNTNKSWLPDDKKKNWNNSTGGDHKVYSMILRDRVEYHFDESQAKISLQPEEGSPYEDKYYFMISGFPEGIKSSGGLNDIIEPTYLTSSQQISELEIVKTDLEVDKGYSYIVISPKTELSIASGGEYLLGENEHFIFGNLSTQDFVDFGSGTLISNISSSSFNPKIVAEIPDNLDKKMSLLENKLTLYNTKIDSYSEGFTISCKNSDFSKKSEWGSVEEEITVRGEDEVEIKYGSGYQYRVGKILTPSKNKTIYIPDNRFFEVSLEGNSLPITIKPKSSGSGYLSFSEDFSTDLEGNVWGGKKDIKISGYGFGLTRTPNNNNEITTVYTGNNFSMTFTASSNTNFTVSLPILSGKKYLLKIETNFSSTGKVTLSGGGIKVLNKSDSSTVLSGKNEEIVYTNTSETLQFSFSNHVAGDSIKIIEFREISGYNKTIDSSLAELVFTKITTTYANTSDLKFDFFYKPESPLPTLDPLSFYDKRHLLNKNILTVIDLSKLANEENLIIVKRK